MIQEQIMNTKALFFTIFFAYSILMAGCGGAAVNTTNANLSNTGNTNNPLAVLTPTPDGITNDAPTLTPVFKAYCAAMIKKDEAALRKVYSQDTIKHFETEMKADGQKSLIKYLEDDQVTEKLCEVRNEQIQADSAIAEIRTEGYPNGIKVVFVKENGEWKLTNRSPEVPQKQTAANSNTK